MKQLKIMKRQNKKLRDEDLHLNNLVTNGSTANEELTRVNDDEVAENPIEENKQDGKQ